MTEETLFHEALAKPPAERAAFLGQACAGQPQLRAAVEALLAAHEASGSLLDRPPVELARTVDSDPAQPEPAPPHLAPTGDHCPKVEPGAVIAGRYTLQEKIGEGGMGEVWVAKQTEPVKRKVALKLIKTGMDSKAVLQRFEQERQALAMMDHPNIARVLDGGLTPTGQPFFVMELVNGLALTKFCDEARLTTKERLELFVPICQPVQHAHQKGIVHRDLKPANILVTLIDGRGVPKVIDFGVAKATAGKLTDESLSTQFGAVVGTLEYMSPEQAGFSGEDIDTRADVYSLGVILYELLTGLRPIDARRQRKAALAEMIHIIQEEEPSKPSTRLSTDESLASLAALRQTEPRKLMALLRGELDCVVMKCLEKQRERRYETANALCRDVQRYLADELVEARPPSAGYRLSKFLKRYKGPVLAAAVVLLALVAGIAGTTIGLVRAEQRRHEAEQAKEDAVKAAAAETAALEQTRRRLGQIEKGVDLLASLLTGINPRNEEKGGPTLYEQLRERASKAADQLDAESVGDAQAMAGLQTVLGDTLRELGDFPKAIAVLEKAHATRERELGEDHPDTLTSRNTLATAYAAAGKLDLAIPLFQRTLKARAAKLGDDHPVTLDSRNNLAEAYLRAGKSDLAIPLFERTLKAFEAKLGDDHPDTLLSRNNLATAYAAAGKLELALPLFERAALGIEKRRFQHENARGIIFNTINAYELAKQLDKAEVWRGKWLAVVQQQTGGASPAYAGELAVLGFNLLRQQKWAAAELPLRECLAIRAKTEPEAWTTFNTKSLLGGSLLGQKKYAEAEPLLLAGYEGMKQREEKIPPPGKIRLPEAAVRLVQLYEAMDKKDEAAKWRKEVTTRLAELLADARQILPKDSPLLADILAQVGMRLLQVNACTDADPLLRECLTIREKNQPDAWDTFNSKSMLGGALLGQKKYAEAEPLLLAGYEGMKQREKTIPPQGKDRLPEAVDRLVQLYEAMDKKDEAAKWRKEQEATRAAPKKPEKQP